MAEHAYGDEVAAKLESLFGGVPELPPVAKELGADLLDVDKGTATFRMDAGSRFHNHVHVVHGSVLSALAELAVGLAITTTLGEDEAFTITGLQTNFMEPVVEGAVEATARVTRRGRTISYVDAQVQAAGADEVACRVMATCYHRRFD